MTNITDQWPPKYYTITKVSVQTYFKSYTRKNRLNLIICRFVFILFFFCFCEVNLFWHNVWSICNVKEGNKYKWINKIGKKRKLYSYILMQFGGSRLQTRDSWPKSNDLHSTWNMHTIIILLDLITVLNIGTKCKLFVLHLYYMYVWEIWLQVLRILCFVITLTK